MKETPVRLLFAIVVGATILQVANGILGVAIPLQLGIQEAAPSVVGAIVTAYSLGFLLGCIRAPSFIRPVGHIRAFSALAALFAVTSLMFVATDWMPGWAILRFVGGFCAAGLFTVIDSWVSGGASTTGRGRILAAYMIFNRIGLMTGQGILAFGHVAGDAYFLLACGCAAFAIVPVSLNRTSGPAPQDTETLGFRAVYRIAPIGVVGCVGAGLVNASMIGLTPIYGLHVGLTTTLVPLLVASAQFGSMLVQWPLGWISDRTDRRHVITAATLGGGVVALGVVLIAGRLPVAMPFLFAIWGGLSLSVYSLCIAHASDFAKPSQQVPLVSSLMLAWAMGSTVGPILATSTMELVGPDGLLYFSAAVSMLVGAFAIWRIRKRAPVPIEDREAFAETPQTSPMGAGLRTSESAAAERGQADHE